MQAGQSAPPSESAALAFTVVDGPFAGSRLAWPGAEAVLGRKAAGASLFRTDPGVSRRHAVLRRGPDGTCLVEDLGSTNGTFVNDVPIGEPTLLLPDDELRIGGTRLRFAPAPGDATLVAAALPPDTGPAGWDPAAEDATAADDAAAGTRRKDGARVRKAGQLTLSILAAIAGTILASALNGSPQLRLAAAVLGSAVPAFVTEPGRHQRQRAAAAAVLMAGALFVTYGGATLFSYATRAAPIYPAFPVRPGPRPKVTQQPVQEYSSVPASGPLSGSAAQPSPTLPPTPTPTPTAAPTPTPTFGLVTSSPLPPGSAAPAGSAAPPTSPEP